MPKYIIANWKQNLIQSDIRAWFEDFLLLVKNDPLQNISIVIAPSYPYLPLLHEYKLANPHVYSSAQDVSVQSNGAHTEKVGISQLTDYCDFCIVGHSETGDSFSLATKKAKLCISNKITPVMCFSNIEDVVDLLLTDLLLAWEDPKNISKGGAYKSKNMDEVIAGINRIKSSLKVDLPILYGGSVNRQNALKLGSIRELGGVLIGQASLDPKHFFDIAKLFEKGAQTS